MRAAAGKAACSSQSLARCDGDEVLAGNRAAVHNAETLLDVTYQA
jgi:hypothetical protein